MSAPKFDAERAEILIRAMVEMLDKQAKSHYVTDPFEMTAIWDGAECDGGCWFEEAKALLGIDA